MSTVYITGTLALSSSTLTQLRDAYTFTTGKPMLNLGRKETIAEIRAAGYNRLGLEWYQQQKGSKGRVSRLILVNIRPRRV